MLFELREYHAQPGKRDTLVRLMEEQIIPMQVQAGMVILGSFVGEDSPDNYVWLRRFENEAERVRLYEAVYQSDRWKNEIAPLLPDLMQREKMRVTRLVPTRRSPIQ
jgi:hypothetical protein